jgi:cystathionine beta-synthase
MIYDNILETIGQTPLVRLHRTVADLEPTVLAKVERMNPGGSVKDRVAYALIQDMEKSGRLKPGGTVVEGSSGNMGVGLAMACAQRGYKCIIVIPDKMSQERSQMIRALGGEVVITRTDVEIDDPASFMSTARRLTSEIPGAVMADQFVNQANPEVHYKTTAEEIWQQTGGQIDAFVMGMGTGGSISGISRFLKEKNPGIRIVGAEPVGSIIKHYFDTGEMREGEIYMVEGIGEDFLPKTLHLDHVDEMMYISDEESFHFARRISREEGIFVGGSSGTNLAVARRLARTMAPGQTIVTLFSDGGERYMSKMYNPDWLQEKGYDLDKDYGEMRGNQA